MMRQATTIESLEARAQALEDELAALRLRLARDRHSAKLELKRVQADVNTLLTRVRRSKAECTSAAFLGTLNTR